MATGKTVKDVSPHDFVKAYASHLKRSGKVSGWLLFFFLLRVEMFQSLFVEALYVEIKPFSEMNQPKYPISVIWCVLLDCYVLE